MGIEHTAAVDAAVSGPPKQTMYSPRWYQQWMADLVKACPEEGVWYPDPLPRNFGYRSWYDYRIQRVGPRIRFNRVRKR